MTPWGWARSKIKSRFRSWVLAITQSDRERLDRLAYLDRDANTIARILLTPDVKERIDLLRLHGAAIGEGVFIERGVWVDFAFLDRILIEDYVRVAAGAMLIAHDSSAHYIGGLPMRAGKVRLKRNCHIGAGAIVLPGVTVGAESIVGIGSVVTRDVPDRTVAAGVPARVIRTVDEHLEILKKRAGETPADFIPWDDPERTPPERRGGAPRP